MKKVLIPTSLNICAKEILEEHGYEVILDAKTPMDELIAKHQDASGLIVRSEKVTSQVIDQLPQLKAIVRAGAGYDNIDTRYARSKGIDVMNTPGANANAVAEEALGLMLASIRHFIPGDRSVREGKWEKKRFLGTELTHKVVGVIGLGAIGQLLCKRLKGFDVKLLGYDPFLSTDRAKELGIDLVDLETIFKNSDFISLHVPQTEETKGLVNEKYLSLMKDGAVIINCARSGVIVEEDLRKVKKEKNIKFGNDVYPKDAEGDKSVSDIADIMLPHLGASTLESNINAAQRAATQMIDLWEKGITRFVVNATVPPELDEKYQDLTYRLAKLGRAWIGNKQVRQIETSFYGKLGEFSEWMISPLVSALDPSFDILSDHREALSHLEEQGIDYLKREADNQKNYGESITIDLFCGSQSLERVSVRGTLTEGVVMLSRVSDFERLYLALEGKLLFFSYVDRPAVLAEITKVLGESQINIHDIRAPHDEPGKRSLAVLKVDKVVPEEVVKQISASIEAEVGFFVSL